MKKFLLIGFILLFSNIILACHLLSLGWCSDSARFETQLFPNNSEVQVRYYDSTNLASDFFTPSKGLSDTIFGVPQQNRLDPIKIQFRYTDSSGEWSSWINWDYASVGYYLSDTIIYPGCSTNIIGFRYFSATKTTDGNLLVKFNVDNSNGYAYYNVLVSNDAKNWVVVKRLNYSYDKNYNVLINLGMSLGGMSLMLIFVAGFKKRYSIIILLLGSIFFFYSCKKDKVSLTAPNYKFVQIQAVSVDGISDYSNIIRF